MTVPRQLLDEAVSEAELQSAVIELAHLRGWLAHHCRPGATASGRWATQIQGDPGFPDVVLVRTNPVPDLIFAEFKTQKGKLTPEQETWLECLVDATNSPVEVHVWRPSDWSSGAIARRLA